MIMGAMTGNAMIGKDSQVATVAPQDGARYATVADGATAHENGRGNPHRRCRAAAQRKET